jgi:hypothetical protein
LPGAQAKNSPAALFPPYGIIQHAIDDRLLEEYCLALQEELFAIIESDAG